MYPVSQIQGFQVPADMFSLKSLVIKGRNQIIGLYRRFRFQRFNTKKEIPILCVERVFYD